MDKKEKERILKEYFENSLSIWVRSDNEYLKIH